MNRKMTKIEIAAAHARDAARALNAAQEAVDAARRIYEKANADWMLLTAKRERQQATEYRITFLLPSDEGGWDTDCDHTDTLREARDFAKARLTRGADAAVIERINRRDDTETVVATYGSASALLAYGCTVAPD